VDVTAQVGATWADVFMMLELHHGLDINNPNHIWLLHYLFLNTINQQLAFFAEGWNQHRIQIWDGPNHSPADMFGFDMIVHGIHGSQLPTAASEPMSEEELEVFGVDWEGLQDDSILQSWESNNHMDEDSGSWLGHTGPPDNLNEVPVEPPAGVFSHDEILHIDMVLQHLAGAVDDAGVVELWVQGLALAQAVHPDLF
jgi:hypothetical protein